MKPIFELTEKQRQLVKAAASPAREILAYGGSRSGKTFGFVYCIATRALMAPKSRHLIARLHGIDVRQSVMMDTWPAVMSAAYPGVPYSVNKSDMIAALENGSEIWFGGLDDKERVEKILGKEFATIYGNEASQIAFDTVLTMRTRLAQNVRKVDGRQLPLKMYYDLNPVGRSHWTYTEFHEGIAAGSHQKLPPGSRAHIQLNPHDNPNLSPEYLEILDQMPERFRKRFRDGEYLSEVPGSLWSITDLDRSRVAEAPELQRIVIGVDPSGSDGTGGDQQGIIVVGKGIDGHAYVIEDGSCRMSPAGWGMRVAQLYDRHMADVIVAEANYGGAMVENTIKTASPNAKVKMVSASRGKHIRAEPVAALYETIDGRRPTAHHVGRFPELEEQLSAFTTSGYQGFGSPDRADALVWALTELMLEDEGGYSVHDMKRAYA